MTAFAKVNYDRQASRLWWFARSYCFDLLIAVGAIESALEVALRHDAARRLDTTLWFAVPAVATVVLGLLWRRRVPFAAPAAVWLLAATLSSVDGRLIGPVAVLNLAGMAASFLLGNLRDVVQGRVGLAVVVSGAAIVVYNDPTHTAGELFFTPGLFAIGWLAGFALRERAAQADAAEQRATDAERGREENTRRAVIEERVRIARELHDVVAHHVSMMGVQAGGARVVIDSDRVKAKAALSAIEVSSRQAVGELHRLLGFLRQPGDEDDLAPRPGLGQLPRLAASMSESGLAVSVGVEGEERLLPPMIGVSAYRIVQEALTNALKHAAASRADVRVRYWPDELEVEIVDDGRGAMSGSGASPGGLGLVGMRERAALHGGQLMAGPVSGGGFAVRVKLPTSGGAL
jgi:signal transduction histidine kinase